MDISNGPNGAQPGKTRYLMAAVSGALAALAYPDYGLWPLAWVCLGPLLVTLRGAAPQRGAALGYVMGLFYFGPTFIWVSNTMIDYGHMPVWLAAAVNALGIVYIAAYIALFGYLVCWTSERSGRDMALVAAPFYWVALEKLRTLAPTFAFPWGRIADTQFTAAPVIQIADLVGEEGLCFLIVLANAALVKLIDWNADRGAGARFPLRWTAFTAALVAGSLIYGYVRLGQFQTPGAPPVSVALIQGNIDQNRKWDRAYRNTQLEIYRRRTLQAVADGAQFVIWPETAAPFYFGSNTIYDKRIMTLAESVKTPILFGAPGIERVAEGTVSYNRAWMVRPDGVAEHYDKVRLVPFGEYVPHKKILFFVNKLTTAVGNQEPGKSLVLLNAGDYKVGTQICFEIIFPQYSRTLAANGAAVIVNITNDSWFGRSAASRQSLAMAVFRAVENRVPVLRAAQSGVSAIITAAGEITGETKLFVETTLAGEFVPRAGPPTLYTLSGGLLYWLIVVLACGFVWLAYRDRRISEK